MVFLRSRADLPETGGTHRSAAVRDRRRHRREHAEHAQSLTARTVWYGEGISKADPLTSDSAQDLNEGKGMFYL